MQYRILEKTDGFHVQEGHCSTYNYTKYTTLEVYENLVKARVAKRKLELIEGIERE